MHLTFTVKNVCNRKLAYPTNHTAYKLCEYLKRVSLPLAHIARLKHIGFEVILDTDAVKENSCKQTPTTT